MDKRSKFRAFGPLNYYSGSYIMIVQIQSLLHTSQ